MTEILVTAGCCYCGRICKCSPNCICTSLISELCFLIVFYMKAFVVHRNVPIPHSSVNIWIRFCWFFRMYNSLASIFEVFI